MRAAGLRDRVLKDFRYKAVAASLAAILWLFVHGTRDVTVAVSVPVTYKIPPERVLVSDRAESVRLTLAGSWANIRSASLDRIRLEIDAAPLALGSTTIALERGLFNIPPGLKLAQMSPSEISLVLVERERKQVRVAVRHTGHPGSGLRLKSIAMIPDTVTIAGPADELYLIEEVPTRTLDLTGHVRGFSTDLPLMPLGRNLSFEGTGSVSVSVDFEADIIIREFPEIPVAVEGCLQGSRCEPSPGRVAVFVSGPRLSVSGMRVADLRVHVAVGSDGQSGDRFTRRIEFSGVPDGARASSRPDFVWISIAEDSGGR